jgi:hypothetical protein
MDIGKDKVGEACRHKIYGISSYLKGIFLVLRKFF